MKKTLIFLALLAVLVPPGWTNPQPGFARPEEISLTKQIASHQAEQASTVEAGFPNPTNWLYPQDIDPPETCHVPSLAPLGQDVEMMLGPWGGSNALLAINQASTWGEETDLSGVLAFTNLDVIALNTEELIAAWADGDGKMNTPESCSNWIIKRNWVRKRQRNRHYFRGPALGRLRPFQLSNQVINGM
jgi:hypothetical protein